MNKNKRLPKEFTKNSISYIHIDDTTLIEIEDNFISINGIIFIESVDKKDYSLIYTDFAGKFYIAVLLHDEILPEYEAYKHFGKEIKCVKWSRLTLLAAQLFEYSLSQEELPEYSKDKITIPPNCEICYDSPNKLGLITGNWKLGNMMEFIAEMIT